MTQEDDCWGKCEQRVARRQEEQKQRKQHLYQLNDCLFEHCLNLPSIPTVNFFDNFYFTTIVVSLRLWHLAFGIGHRPADSAFLSLCYCHAWGGSVVAKFF